MDVSTFLSRHCIIVDDYSGEVDASSPDQKFLAPFDQSGWLTTGPVFFGRVMSRKAICSLVSAQHWAQARPLDTAEPWAFVPFSFAHPSQRGEIPLCDGDEVN